MAQFEVQPKMYALGETHKIRLLSMCFTDITESRANRANDFLPNIFRRSKLTERYRNAQAKVRMFCSIAEVLYEKS